MDSLLALHRDRPTALLVIAHELLDRSERIEEAGVLPLAGVVGDTVGVIEAGQQNGSVRPGDPVVMTAALHGALLHGVLGRDIYTRTAGRDAVGPDWSAEVARTVLTGVVLSPT